MPEALLQRSSQPDVASQFLEDVLAGLSEHPKSLPPKYFYDSEGSRCFDAICELDEYYPYRTELAMLPRVAEDLAEVFQGPLNIVEFGAGALKKIQPLIQRLEGLETFIPIDIAGEFLSECCTELKQRFPFLNIQPIVADLCEPVSLPNSLRQPRLGFFPGSTIGNFAPDAARRFLRNAGRTLGSNSYLLIGVDTKKSPDLLHRAYNDKQALTARFNLNLLTRINRELGADFALTRFEHYAFYNLPRSRIEMHLVSKDDQVVNVAGEVFRFARGESIHTENSYKYNIDEFRRLAEQADWQAQRTWLSRDGNFSVHLLRHTG